MNWEQLMDAAMIDLQAAHGQDKLATLGHLRDAAANLTRAIEALEEEVDS